MILEQEETIKAKYNFTVGVISKWSRFFLLLNCVYESSHLSAETGLLIISDEQTKEVVVLTINV